jgi:hypothetical protein
VNPGVTVPSRNGRRPVLLATVPEDDEFVHDSVTFALCSFSSVVLDVPVTFGPPVIVATDALALDTADSDATTSTASSRPFLR